MASPEELVKFVGHLYEMERFLRENMRHARYHDGVELFEGEIHTLQEISLREGISQAELSQRMVRTKGATSTVVDKLEGKGLVRRVRSDTRCLLYLTDLGRQVQRAREIQEQREANRVVEELPVELEDLAVANEVIEALLSYCRDRCPSGGGDTKK